MELVTISKQIGRLNKREMSSAAGPLRAHLQEVNTNNTSYYGCIQSVTCNYHELIDICIISKVMYFRGQWREQKPECLCSGVMYYYRHDVLLWV